MVPPSNSCRDEERQIWLTQVRHSHSTRTTRIDRQRPGFQILVCIELAVDGGAKLLVDGSAQAEKLRRDSPQAFHTLATRPRIFRFYDAATTTDLKARETPFQLDTYGRVVHVRYNYRSVVPPNCDDHMSHNVWTQFGSQLTQAKPLKIRLSQGNPPRV